MTGNVVKIYTDARRAYNRNPRCHAPNPPCCRITGSAVPPQSTPNPRRIKPRQRPPAHPGQAHLLHCPRNVASGILPDVKGSIPDARPAVAGFTPYDDSSAHCGTTVVATTPFPPGWKPGFTAGMDACRHRGSARSRQAPAPACTGAGGCCAAPTGRRTGSLGSPHFRPGVRRACNTSSEFMPALASVASCCR